MTDASTITDAEMPVQKQVEAYDARDIDAFMAWWAHGGDRRDPCAGSPARNAAPAAVHAPRPTNRRATSTARCGRPFRTSAIRRSLSMMLVEQDRDGR